MFEFAVNQVYAVENLKCTVEKYVCAVEKCASFMYVNGMVIILFFHVKP
jgi:hypothetical protein